MIEQIKQALEKATGNGKWSVGKESPNGLQNIGHKGLMICQAFKKEDAHLIANAPEWLRYHIVEVERLSQHNEENGQLAYQLQQERLRLRRENEELRKALEWYAAEDTHIKKLRDYGNRTEIALDKGYRARQALERTKP